MSTQSSGRRWFRRRPRFTGALTLMVMLAQTGCYTYAPASRELRPGMGVAYTLTDRGRVAMADQVGSGVLRVEGSLLENTGSAYVIKMSRVQSIDGSRSRWGGERVTVSHDHVANSFERKLSKQRTAIAIGATVVGLTVFAITRNLTVFGLGFGPEDPRIPDPNQ